MLAQSENGKLRAALVANLKSAVTASFLMLPESFTEEDLFLQIAGLSYAGNSSAQLQKTERIKFGHNFKTLASKKHWYIQYTQTQKLK